MFDIFKGSKLSKLEKLWAKKLAMLVDILNLIILKCRMVDQCFRVGIQVRVKVSWSLSNITVMLSNAVNSLADYFHLFYQALFLRTYFMYTYFFGAFVVTQHTEILKACNDHDYYFRYVLL